MFNVYSYQKVWPTKYDDVNNNKQPQHEHIQHKKSVRPPKILLDHQIKYTGNVHNHHHRKIIIIFLRQYAGFIYI